MSNVAAAIAGETCKHSPDGNDVPRQLTTPAWTTLLNIPGLGIAPKVIRTNMKV